MKPDQLPKSKQQKGRPAPGGRTSRPTASGASAGLPLFLKGAQAKLKEGRQGDAFEQHADKIAGAAQSGSAYGEPAAPASEASQDSAAAIPTADSGSPLHAQIRGSVEPVLGADLSHVRVHQGEADRATAGMLGARAFTHGSHIWMGPRESSSDLKLMAHEAAHVVQQGATPGAPSLQKQQPQTAAAGTTDQLVVVVNNPNLEADTGLRTVITMLNRYTPTVDLGAVDFRVMTTTPSFVGPGLFEEGQSYWDGNKPVIELTQEKYDTIAKHLAGTAAIGDVYDVIRTVGHELYHLYRGKMGNQANPIQPVFKAEAAKQMEQIRQNWIHFAQDPGGAKELGIPKGQTVTKWEDIPAIERNKIEEGASQTSVIKGLYEQTSYLVEEIYVKIEEISYLRVQQQAETGPKRPSLASVADIAKLIARFSNALDQSVGTGFMTAALLEQTRTAMLQYLRKRYPHRANPSLDSFEVLFYLNAKARGLAPMFDAKGALISAAPPEARVP